MSEQYKLNVNGSDYSLQADADMPLLYALANNLGLKGPKFGCGLAQCGACTGVRLRRAPFIPERMLAALWV